MKKQYSIYLTAISILFFIACSGSSTKKTQESQVANENTASNQEISENPDLQEFDNRFAIIFPYIEVYDYADYDEEEEEEQDEEIENPDSPVYQNDTIAFGGSENDYAVLNGTLELGKKWICIDFSFYDSEDYKAKAKTGTTTTHSEDWLEQPITVTDIKDIDATIAFQGKYNESDFIFHNSKPNKEKSEVAAKLMDVIRTAYDSEQLSKPAKLTTDTLLFKQMTIHSSNPDIYSVLLETTQYSDSDSDNTNQLMYIISNNTVKYVEGGMSCYGPLYFSLKGKQYLILLSHTYASSSVTLFDVSKSLAEPIYTSFVVGD